MPAILREFFEGTDAVSEASCVIYMFFNRTSIVGNISHISLIAIQRFVSVLFPLKSKIWITVAKVKKVTLLTPTHVDYFCEFSQSFFRLQIWRYKYYCLAEALQLEKNHGLSSSNS